jgi:hypothetical protein
LNNQLYPDQNLPEIAAGDDEVLAAIALELAPACRSAVNATSPFPR